MSKIKTIEDLIAVVNNRVNEFENIKEEYLSEAGKAAREAYKNTLWHLCFHGSIESLREDEEFTTLIFTSGKHPEYYKILRMIYRTISK